MKPKFSYKHLIIHIKSLNKLKITGILCILLFASAVPLFPESDAVSNSGYGTHRMTKKEVKNKIESAVSNKVYFSDFSGRLTNADKSNFKQSIFQFSFTIIILIILGIIVVIAVTIAAARKLKQKSFRDKLDKARDLLFEINSRHEI